MSAKPSKIVIDYYSDVLCVWAWIAQARLDELQKQWGDQVSLSHHFVEIFGNTHKKIPAQWGENDGYERFAAHVHQVAEPYPDAPINPDLWTTTRPSSSAQAHLFLRAIELVAGESMLSEMALCLRHTFFVQGRDISDMTLLYSLAEDRAIDKTAVASCLNDGSAIAALSSDQKQATEMGVRGSPSWILNNGRQILYGNVGYRILNANIEELLKHPAQEASWC